MTIQLRVTVPFSDRKLSSKKIVGRIINGEKDITLSGYLDLGEEQVRCEIRIPIPTNTACETLAICRKIDRHIEEVRNAKKS